MSEYDDLDLGIDELTAAKAVEVEEEVVVEEAPPAPKKKASKKKPAAVDEGTSVKAVEPEIDPEFDRDNWPTIMIDHENDKPNYEFVSAHGTTKNGKPFGWDMQIMRGVEVKVPPSIVYALQDAVSTHYPTVLDPITKEKKQLRQNRSAVPWRLVHGGKHL